MYFARRLYNDLDNIKEIWYTENEGTPTLAYSYTYTAKGQLFSIEDCINGRTTVYEYDRNGRVVASSEYETESYTNIFGSSVYYDDETGFYYLNSRYYDPAIGRFNFNNHAIGVGIDVGFGISFHMGFSFSISGFLISLYD